MKDAQVTGEAFSPQKGTFKFKIQNMKFLYIFLFLWAIFALLDPDQQLKLMRILNPGSAIHAPPGTNRTAGLVKA
jgi:hypothetical protein